MNELNNNGSIVHVDAYNRENGHVQSHTRSAPGSGSNGILEKSENSDEWFNMVVENTLFHEGGYEDRPHMIDRPTNRGIRQPTLDSFRKRNPQLDFIYPTDVKDLTPEQTRYIYYHDYYKPYRIKEIKNKRIAEAVFDMHTMTGPIGVANIIQDSLITSGYQVKRDGTFGSESIGALNKVSANGDTHRFVDILKGYRTKFLKELPTAKNNPGWFERTNSY